MSDETQDTKPKNLAFIVRIKDLSPIINKDRIEVASIEDMAWKCVVKKGEFKVGDLGVYFSIDTVVDSSNPGIAFMSERKSRVRSCKYGGVLSQGLLMPLNIINYWTTETSFNPGQDISELVKSQKWESPVTYDSGNARGQLPTILRMSDELNIKSYSKVFDEFKDLEIVLVTKMDGSSKKSFFHNGYFGVCSRKLEKIKSETDMFWKTSIKYNIEEKMTKLGKNIAICAELCGGKCNGNKMGLGSLDMFVYDVWDIDNQVYMGYDDIVKLTDILELKRCPLLYRGSMKWNSIEELQEFVNPLKYENGEWIEGAVLRSCIERYSPVLDKRLSVKIINDNFAVKFGI